MKATLGDVLFYTVRSFHESNGVLSPIESNIDVPFHIKRVFYVRDVPTKDIRGKHSHYKTEQVLICLHGSCEVVCKDGRDTATYDLHTPDQALYIPAMIWDEQIYNSKDTILMVLASSKYSKPDYITDFDQYVKENTKV